MFIVDGKNMRAHDNAVRGKTTKTEVGATERRMNTAWGKTYRVFVLQRNLTCDEEVRAEKKSGRTVRIDVSNIFSRQHDGNVFQPSIR